MWQYFIFFNGKLSASKNANLRKITNSVVYVHQANKLLFGSFVKFKIVKEVRKHQMRNVLPTLRIPG